MNIFGRIRLGYVVVDTEKLADWRRFGRDAIGMHLDDVSPDVQRFRLDDHECRFLVQRGPAEDVTALGWQVDDHRTFDEIVTRVTRHGLPVANGTVEETTLRGVERVVRFPGPNGLRQEIFTRPGLDDAALNMAVHGGFVTGEAGIGHVAVTPSGFEWEVGWNPIMIDEKTWEPTTYQGISLWGHTREGQTIVEKLAQFKIAAQSLLHREDTVPALAAAAIPDD